MNFTHNNHLKYTIGDRLYGYRETPYEKFIVNVGTIDHDYYKTSNWVNEQYRTADIISKEYGKEFALMFSGGTDSEIVLRSFLKIGVTPRIFFVRFANGYNHNDYLEALEVTDSLGVKLEVIDFDVIEFFNSGQAKEFSVELQCRQIAYLTIYYHIKNLQLPAVMGGEMLFQRKVNTQGSRWFYSFRENQDASAMRLSLKYNIPLVNEWFSYTPEMMLYYLEHPKIKWLLTERYNYKMASFSTKNEVLRQYMPDLFDRIKTHGFEHLLGFNNEVFYKLNKDYPKRLESSLDGIYVDELEKKLRG